MKDMMKMLNKLYEKARIHNASLFQLECVKQKKIIIESVLLKIEDFLMVDVYNHGVITVELNDINPSLINTVVELVKDDLDEESISYELYISEDMHAIRRSKNYIKILL